MRRDSGAVISNDGRYRYSLWRIDDHSKPLVLFIMLNPSTADARVDDNTVRRCTGFSRAWGMGGFLVGNLFGFRTSNPKDLKGETDIIGRENDRILLQMAARAEKIVCAWGAYTVMSGRVEQVMDLLAGRHLYCLRLTKAWAPKHPLYLSRDVTPAPWPLAYGADSRRPRLNDKDFKNMCELIQSTYAPKREASVEEEAA